MSDYIQIFISSFVTDVDKILADKSIFVILGIIMRISKKCSQYFVWILVLAKTVGEILNLFGNVPSYHEAYCTKVSVGGGFKGGGISGHMTKELFLLLCDEPYRKILHSLRNTL